MRAPNHQLGGDQHQRHAEDARQPWNRIGDDVGKGEDEEKKAVGAVFEDIDYILEADPFALPLR